MCHEFVKFSENVIRQESTNVKFILRENSERLKIGFLTKMRLVNSRSNTFWLYFIQLIFQIEAHWINLHVWYDQIMEQQNPPPPLTSTYMSISSKSNESKFNSNSPLSTSYHHLLMQQDSAIGPPLPLPTPESLHFHQPRPLPSCERLPGLTQPQIDICKVFTDHMKAVIQGAKLGLKECRWQFRYNHWNCSSPPLGQDEKISLRYSSSSTGRESSKRNGRKLSSGRTTRKTTSQKRSITNSHENVLKIEELEKKWNSVLKHGSKEVAFAHAVWSAAVAQAIARACRDGSLTSCSCGKTSRPSTLKGEWRWGGCGDNLQYGYKFSREFVDSREKEKMEDRKASARALVNLHNNEAGRRAVLKKTKVACKCHGVSGSCALVTCWHQVPSFREIGDTLKDRYAKATLVKMNRRGRLQVKRSTDKVPSVHDLVYIDASPNYCLQNTTLGVPGPSGRICNKTSSGPDGCKSLCCNKGYTTTVSKKSTRCHCKFVWCCQVICQECKKVQKISTCK